MRHLLAVILATVILQPIFGMDSGQTVQVDSLLSQRKYYSAEQFLDKLDPGNGDPDALIRKVHICINFFVQSINHKIFAFKDLSADESVEALRKQGGKFQLTMPLDVPEAIGVLLKQYPTDGRLYSALGDFYADVNLRYGKDELFKGTTELAIDAYQRATALGTIDAANQAALGLLSLQAQNYQLAEDSYRRALKLDVDNAEDNYNLALALMNLSKFPEAAKYSKAAYDKYTDQKLKRDALLMFADSNLYQGKYPEALVLYQRIVSGEPNNLFPIRRLMQCYLALDRMDDLRQAFASYLSIGGNDPVSISRLSGVFQQTVEHTKIYIDLADKWLSESAKTTEQKGLEAQGILSYYEGFAYQALGNQSMFKKRLSEASGLLSKVYPSDNPIFAQIEKDLATVK